MKINNIQKATLLNGDCLDQEIINKIPNNIDIVFTSPPYNIGDNGYYGYENGIKIDSSIKKKYQTQEGGQDNRDDYVDWLEKIIRTYLEKSQYFFLNIQKLSNNRKQINELIYRLNDVYCDEIIWDKNNGIPNGLNKRVMTNVIEYIYIFSKKSNRAVGTKIWNGTVKNKISLSGNQRNKFSSLHKAMFPEHIVDYIMENFVKEGGKVLDVFGGLFTTSLVGNNRGIETYSIEKDETYYEEGIKRLSEINITFDF